MSGGIMAAFPLGLAVAALLSLLIIPNFGWRALFAFGVGHQFCCCLYAATCRRLCAFAAQHPDCMSRLILIDTTPRYTDEMRTMWAERAAIARSKGIATLVDGLLKIWFSAGALADDTEAVRYVRASLARCDGEGVCACLRSARASRPAGLRVVHQSSDAGPLRRRRYSKLSRCRPLACGPCRGGHTILNRKQASRIGSGEAAGRDTTNPNLFPKMRIVEFSAISRTLPPTLEIIAALGFCSMSNGEIDGRRRVDQQHPKTTGTRSVSDRTLDYYNLHADAFWRGTRDHDVSQNILALLQSIEGQPPFSILDFGCGPGRDLKAFTQLGHVAIGLEGAVRFAEMARAHSGCEVWQQDFLALDLPEGRFDGIFANASLFHVPSRQLPKVLLQLRTSLKPRGILFCSNPHGHNEEGWDSGRYCVYHEPEVWHGYGKATGFLEVGRYFRPAGLPRDQQLWLATVWRRVDRS
jgi:SAM-dependent methyltransferase